MKNACLVFFLSFFVLFVSAQQPKKPTSSEIYHNIQKLNFLGSALYIAAHPDDENTRLIAHFANHVKARTAYLSLTRGDGGQNLIGPELRELLGVIRTEELLAARAIDGGEQRFTRANDFGFSKHPDETFEIWNKNDVLADVVWAIRTFKPDIIVNRFDHRSPGSTHGHHTGSAMLSVEAFDLANDATKYPEQLKYTQVWQPKRLFFNTSWWFYGSEENFAKADKTNLLSLEVGYFYPHLGLSNSEIAALSRSKHSSQGFGSSGSRGSETEYLEFLKGDFPDGKTDVFEGINTGWTRVKNGEHIANILLDVEKNFNFKDPSVHIPQLILAYQLIEKIEDEHWRNIKSEEIKNIISQCAGLYLEAVAKTAGAVPGEKVSLTIEAINRSAASITLKDIIVNPTKEFLQPNKALENNQSNIFNLDIQIAENQAYTAPYWLMEPGTLGMYAVNNPLLIGQPVTKRPVTVTFNLLINNMVIPVTKNVVFKFTEPSKGEIYQPFEILPPATVSIANNVTIFADGSPKKVPVKVKAGIAGVSGEVSMKAPDGWAVTPKSETFTLARKGEESTHWFTITPPKNENVGLIVPQVTIKGQTIAKKLVEMDYGHIPKQSVLLPSDAKVVRLNLEKAGENIGYIAGAGDEVPESLSQIGYNVVTLDVSTLDAQVLSRFDAIVLGIRAYNVVDALKFKQKILLEYVNNGGNLIVQYNTAPWRGTLEVENLAPYALQISSDRVTDENAEVSLLATNHSLLNFPNKITQEDFNGWTQERGLYFPSKWGPEFTPILSMADKGETQKEGSLLVAPYGKGHYIYTGLSFFRQLPEGVPGAFKLFANMLSIGKSQVEVKENFKE